MTEHESEDLMKALLESLTGKQRRPVVGAPGCGCSCHTNAHVRHVAACCHMDTSPVTRQENNTNE